MMRVKDTGIAGRLPYGSRGAELESDMDEFDGEATPRFDDWKQTVLAYGLVAIGTCIVIYGVVGQ